MFWAGTRNIIRSRGIVSFRDHFSVPSSSQLSKYQKQIVELCGLKNDFVGRPGIQSKAAELWVNSKTYETGGQNLCLSISMDAKKISVSETGLEDLAGLGNTKTNEEEIKVFETEMANLEALVTKNDRKGVLDVFDSITMMSQQLVNRIVAIEKLIIKNDRQLERNQLLAKYIYVLKNQLSAGGQIVKNMKELQSQIIAVIADKRNCQNLVPVKGTVDLGSQGNFRSLTNIVQEDEDLNLGFIKHARNNELIKLPWSDLIPRLTRKPEQFKRNTRTFASLHNACYLSSDQIHLSCGMGKSTPVQDMKNAWTRAHSKVLNNAVPSESSHALVATFCSNIAPMIFGKNCIIAEGGIHIKNGVCASPDLLVMNSSNSRKVDYTVRIFECTSNVYQLSHDSLATCLADSYICESGKGSIGILHSDEICVAFFIPSDSMFVERMLGLADSYIKAGRCIAKRNRAMLTEIKELQTKILEALEQVTILGCYPVVEKVSFNEDNERSSSQVHTRISISIPILRSFMKDTRCFLAKKAKELVALNISDLSGNQSKTPHTILGATYLTSSSLKLVGSQCIGEVCKMLTKNGAKVLNIGVDGESLHLASVLPNGTPGTVQALVKHLYERLKSLKKERLNEIVSFNPDIDISEEFPTVTVADDYDKIEEFETQDKNEEQITEDLLNSAALLENEIDEITKYTLEDVEDMLKAKSEFEEINHERKNAVKKLNISQLRMICLKHIIPKAKQIWLSSSLGRDSFEIHLGDGEKISYTPNSVFENIDDNYFRTISFDYAHLINLFREHAAKGRLFKLGLDAKNLEILSRKSGYEYLKRIIATKGNKLMFDSMNQKAAASLFSDKTAEGLQAIGDKPGAKCVKLISDGLGALDESGIHAISRIKQIIAFKNYLEEHNDVLDRLKRADSQNMTNELLQMVLTTLDSYMYTSVSMQFFNVRRKGRLSISYCFCEFLNFLGTGTVEQLFGQLMMMTDGCGKLNVRQLQDVLKRLMLTNALRLLPPAVRGFQFLNQLKQHMKSYKPDDFVTSDENTDMLYPILRKFDGNIFPSDSIFDKPRRVRRKRTLYNPKALPQSDSASGDVRKFHKKFP